MVLKGARQVGKTWLMKEFGKSCYKNYVYFNFDEEDELKSIFESNKNPGGSSSFYPLTFEEFLEAADESLFTYYRDIKSSQTIEEIFHNQLLEAYHYYLIIGGMPECVSSWIKYKAPRKLRKFKRN